MAAARDSNPKRSEGFAFNESKLIRGSNRGHGAKNELTQRAVTKAKKVENRVGADPGTASLLDRPQHNTPDLRRARTAPLIFRA